MAYCLYTLARKNQNVKLKIIQMTQELNNQITGSTDTQSAERSLLEYLKPKSEDRFSKLEAPDFITFLRHQIAHDDNQRVT